ncbi:MAG: hypothetical protein QX196_02420 [Methylococcaceae bacterium]
MSLISSNVKIVVLHDDGRIKHEQPYSDFLSTPNPHIQSAMYGNSLLDLLTTESYIDENLHLRQVLTGNTHADATRLIGNIAEALIVKYCNDYPEVNRTLATYARFGIREHKNMDNYVAIGTALQDTKSNYGQHYNPNDTQRDIIWIDKTDKENQLLCVGGNSRAGKVAGLQVKASHDGLNYVLPSIKDYFYSILFFTFI